MEEKKYEGIEIQNSFNAGSKDVFNLRETYESVFPDIVYSYDFNSKGNNLYGRIDGDRDIVHANEFYLKQVSSTKSENLFCLNFVADAFEDLRDTIKVQYANRLQPDDFFTTDWDAYSAWQSPHSFYDNKMSDLNQVFSRGTLFANDNKDQIRNIEDFIKLFLDKFYVSMNGNIPITKSGVLTSKYYNPSATGLCVEISDTGFGLDSVKFDKFIKSPNFEFYLLAAADHGFFVDKNAPWRLIANLQSPRMQQYMSLNEIDSTNVFDTCFIKTYKYDVQNLKVYMKQFYDSFLSTSPYYIEKIPIFSTLKCPPDKIQDNISKLREVLTYEEYEQKYDDAFWLKLYYRLKLNEMVITQSKEVLSKELQNIQILYNSLDFEQTLDYINDRIKSQTS